jgi:hypothetical protein
MIRALDLVDGVRIPVFEGKIVNIEFYVEGGQAECLSARTG